MHRLHSRKKTNVHARHIKHAERALNSPLLYGSCLYSVELTAISFCKLSTKTWANNEGQMIFAVLLCSRVELTAPLRFLSIQRWSHHYWNDLNRHDPANSDSCQLSPDSSRVRDEHLLVKTVPNREWYLGKISFLMHLAPTSSIARG